MTRGLPSLEDARRERKRLQWMPASFWKWAALFIGAGIIVWWKLEEGAIARMKNELLARQRAVKDELGPRWFPLRDKIEKWTAECAAGDFREQPGPELARAWDFRKMNGIYLRLGIAGATSSEAIRAAAQKSLHDAFTSCLLLVNNPNPIAGPACETTADCRRGELCNDYKHCATHSQPYNLRLAYKTMYVMTDEWVADIQDISNKLTVRGAVATFDAINTYDLPVAAEMLTLAKYFLVVVDEDAPADGAAADESLPSVDAGTADDRSIPTTAHDARVCVWRLADDKRMLALRGRADGQLVGGGDILELSTRIAQRRQANSCALALDVREAMGAEAGAKVPDEGSTAPRGADAGAPDGGAKP